MKLSGIIAPSILITVLLIIALSEGKKHKAEFAYLSRKEHPFRFLYPAARCMRNWCRRKFKIKPAACGFGGYWKKIKAVEVNCDVDKYAELIWYKNFSYIFVSVIISLLCIIFINISYTENNFITGLLRQDSGGKNSTYSVDVTGLTDDTQTIQIDVGERQLCEAEVQRLFAQICEELPVVILNNNGSTDSVSTDLYLPGEWDDTGIAISWSSSDTKLINSEGKVYAENADIQGEAVSLTALISYMDYFCESRIDICVLPRLQNESQYLVNEFSGYIQELESNSREDETFELPENYGGNDISYKLHKDYRGYYMLPVLILAAGALKVLSEREHVDKKWQRRNSQMMSDYSEIVSKLSVLVSAGLPVRSAWERIAKEYEEGRINNKTISRYAYEEMLSAQRKLEGGITEVFVYEEFGQSCGLHNYIKLGNILSQSVRKGYKGLAEMLQKEAMDSFEERKNMARRQGEEAGVKLLMPMIMLFAVVLIILVFPAFMSI